uniref:Ig-like domain-containing protein n=1 Tax=Cebus imitator TaxID=2715852 RepID=A0A2K5RTD4_CEBIM
MVCLRLPGGSCMAALTVLLMVLSSPLALAGDTRHKSRFLRQFKPGCHFLNEMERVRFLVRHVYNQEEYVRFDSDVGEFRKATELGRPSAEYCSSRKDYMEETRAHYRIGESFTEQRRVEPKVTVYPAKTQPLQHHNLLICSVSGFYPGSIEVVFTGLIQNGDWTFQTLVMLETVPQSGEAYICQVEHPSVMSPLTVQWRAQSESAQSKMLSGVGGFVLGLLFLGTGLFIYFRNQKGEEPLIAGFLHSHFRRRKEKICFAKVSSQYMSGPV